MTTAIPIGISIKEGDWDENARTVRRTYKGIETVTRLNMMIQRKRSEALESIVKLHEKGQLEILSVSELKDKIFQPANSTSFFLFTRQLIEDLENAGRYGTAKSYREVVHVVQEYMVERDLPFKGITYDFLTRFENRHVSKGNSLNGLAVYLRTIRSIYNKAMKSGLIDRESYPFETYKIKTVPTEKRALDWELIRRIILLKLDTTDPLFNARNYFVASYMMYGMNFSDMAFLKKADIKDGRIVYRRKKTSKIYDIKVTESLGKILEYYSDLSSNSEFLFPILKSTIPAQQYRDILWARKRYNKKLKALGELLEIDQKLTSYVSRHSFATQAMLNQVPLNAISSMLGHSNLKTTEIYLKSLPSSILDDYNAKLLNF